jgi:hypothetical protein
MFEITHMHGTFSYRVPFGTPHDMLEEHMAFFPGQSVMLGDRPAVIQALLGSLALLAGFARPVPVNKLRAID